ncbi:hypothetical protein D6774_02380 [Candidatus Woesearchaeota archaeon]|nr:MAG: hypothetical protein D6774_02380 [Candidatus Woesearchaeota archaeon]
MTSSAQSEHPLADDMQTRQSTTKERVSLKKWDELRAKLGRVPRVDEWRCDLVDTPDIQELKQYRDEHAHHFQNNTQRWTTAVGLGTLIACLSLGANGTLFTTKIADKELVDTSSSQLSTQSLEPHAAKPLTKAANQQGTTSQPNSLGAVLDNSTTQTQVQTELLSDGPMSAATTQTVFEDHSKQCAVIVGETPRTLLDIYEELRACKAPHKLSKTQFLHALFDLGTIHYRKWAELSEDVATRRKEVYATHRALQALLQHKLSVGECLVIPSLVYAGINQEQYPDPTYCIQEGTPRERYGYTRIRHILFGAKGYPYGFCPTPQGIPVEGCTLEQFITKENQGLLLKTLVANTTIEVK